MVDRTNNEFGRMAEKLYPGEKLYTNEQVTEVIAALAREKRESAVRDLNNYTGAE